MCIILFSTKHPDYSLIVLSNRDEFFDRPTDALSCWQKDVISGRDTLRGGTWFGVSKTGKFAALTNFRTPEEQTKQENAHGDDEVVIKSPLSRGMLPLQFLTSKTASPESFMKELVASSEQQLSSFGGFSLVCGSLTSFKDEGMLVLCNSTSPSTTTRILTSDEEQFGWCCELTNSVITTPWPKSQRGKVLLNQIVDSAARGEDLLESLFGVLHDNQFTEEAIATMSTPELLRNLRNSIFIPRLPILTGYGTRQQTVLLVDKSENPRVQIVERTIHDDGNVTEVKESFTIAT